MFTPAQAGPGASCSGDSVVRDRPPGYPAHRPLVSLYNHRLSSASGRPAEALGAPSRRGRRASARARRGGSGTTMATVTNGTMTRWKLWAPSASRRDRHQPSHHQVRWLSRRWKRERSRGATPDPRHGPGPRCANAATGSCGCPMPSGRSWTRRGMRLRIFQSRRSSPGTSHSRPSDRSSSRFARRSSTDAASCSCGASTSRAGRSSARHASTGESGPGSAGRYPRTRWATSSAMSATSTTTPATPTSARTRPPSASSTTRIRATSWGFCACARRSAAG